MSEMTPNFAVGNEADLASPAMLIFLEAVDRNLRQMVRIARDVARLRPHVKTHKLEPLVRRQIALGITKFKTATIAETEMCAAAGASDVLLAYPPAGPAGARLCTLAQMFPKTRFSTIVDNAAAIRGLSVAARAADLTLDVWLDLNVGMNRTGMLPGPAAAELYALIADTPGLKAAGLHAYDGHLHESDLSKRRAMCDDAFGPVLKLRADLEASGLRVPALVAGGSPTFPIHAEHEDREYSPGTTTLWDWGYGDRMPDLPFEIAAVLLTRVVSKPAPNRLCLDIGHKGVAAENPLKERVRILEIPDAVPVLQSEEHLVVETACAGEFAIGQALHGLPKHICPTVALHSEVIVVADGIAGEKWPVVRCRRLTV